MSDILLSVLASPIQYLWDSSVRVCVCVCTLYINLCSCSPHVPELGVILIHEIQGYFFNVENTESFQK